MMAGLLLISAKLQWQKAFSNSIALLQHCLSFIPLIISLISLLFFSLLGHLPGLFICSFHLPRMPLGPLICSAPTAPLGRTQAAAFSQRPACLYRYSVTDKDREWLFEREHPDTGDKLRKGERCKEKGKCMELSFIPHVIGVNGVFERAIWCYSGVCPFGKVGGLSRLICCWITLGEFWLMRSRRGHTAALSGDGGLEQMGWLNQGESSGLDVHFVWVYTWARPNVCVTLTRGPFTSIDSWICPYSLILEEILAWRQPEPGICH